MKCYSKSRLGQTIISKTCRYVATGKATKIHHKGFKHKSETIEFLKIINKKKALKKEKNPMWKGGITSQNKIDRDHFQKTIQKQVFERDNYTCQICGKKGGFLQVDHIQSWTDYVELRFNMENYRTVCMKCYYFITFNKPMPENIKTWGHNLFQARGGNYYNC